LTSIEDDHIDKCVPLRTFPGRRRLTPTSSRESPRGIINIEVAERNGGLFGQSTWICEVPEKVGGDKVTRYTGKTKL